jgi:preprotein translocase subunit SecA
VAAANDFEPRIKALDDAALGAKTVEFRRRLSAGESAAVIVPEACAVVREAARRTLGLRHFDEQLIGGLVLNDGRIAEMRTGEGKTLVATVPAYLNALAGEGVHVVTVNEYLAGRDADWMGPVYRFLGMEVGVVRSGQAAAEKKAAYAADVTYGTNSEFGFDYLRDNLAFRLEDQVQRSLGFALVDEVDSILIDEARTPLIIGAPSGESSDLYLRVDRIVLQLTRQPRVPKEKDDGGPGDFAADEKLKRVFLSEAGHQRVEELMVREGLVPAYQSLYDPRNVRLMYHLTAALRAHALYRRDVDYIVRNGEVLIVDESTGRALEGRRWSDGLHQAIEAKERVTIRAEQSVVASISFQNYFRQYVKLAGMTGTAATEAYEFEDIYRLEVVVIPTHRPQIRRDEPDLVFLTAKDKFAAVIRDIKDCRERGQPVLVGTTAVGTSELLSGLLTAEGLPHQVLNAKQHEREAMIVAEAGRPGVITIATNMAGRGTDIVLGGNLAAELAQLGTDATEAEREQHRREWQQRHDAVIAAGGLHIIGTERHESRRIDNQLRGRSGRQGDPGSSRFYLSIEDHLMRVFGDQQRLRKMLDRIGVAGGAPIESPLLNRQIETAQRKIEERNFDIRKQLLWYDDVANEQRKAVYEQRNLLLRSDDISASLADIRADVVRHFVDRFAPPESMADSWDLAGLAKFLNERLHVQVSLEEPTDGNPTVSRDRLYATVTDAVTEQYRRRTAAAPEDEIRRMEKQAMLELLDENWREHLAAVDAMKQGIHLRGIAHRNPKDEYKREAFELFTEMMARLKRQLVRYLATARVRSPEEVMAEWVRERRAEEDRRNMAEFLQPRPGASRPRAINVVPGNLKPWPRPDEQFPRPAAAVDSTPSRNQPCPCGSGTRYRQCHGRLS